MQVSQVMTRDVATISPWASVAAAARVMDDLDIGALPVCDGRRLIGIVTDRDITIRCTAAGGSPETHVHEVMTDDVRWCRAEDDIAEAERIMAAIQIRRLPVVNRNRELVGMIALADLFDDRVPGADATLRRISAPAAPDRAGRATREAQETASDRPGSDPDPRYGPADYGPGQLGLRELRGAFGPVSPRRRRAPDRDETGIGPSGMDWEERYQEDRAGDDLALGFRDAGFERGPGHRRADSDEADFDRGYRPERGRDRAVFDRARRRSPLGIEGYGARGADDARRSDAGILDEVTSRLADADELDARWVQVAVRDGEITLRGRVGGHRERWRAEDIAASVPGTTGVRNRIDVGREGRGPRQ